jgi:hypothetical protein
MNLQITRTKLNAWIDLASADQIARGKTWYIDAHAFAQTVADTYHLPIEKVVGVISCLSVGNRWEVNKRDAETLCRGYAEGWDLTGITVASYSNQKAKAIAILQAADGVDIPPLVASRYGPKTLAFYDNILKPHTSYRVTLDRWIGRALGLEHLFGNGGANRYVAAYRHLEELFRQVAIERHLRACELQAIVWLTVQEYTEPAPF